MVNVILQFETSTILFFVAVCFVAGFDKGIVGFAMPMIILSGSATIEQPSLGLAVLILPTLSTKNKIVDVSNWRITFTIKC